MSTRTILSLLVVVILAMPATTSAQSRPQNIVYVRDYTTANCSADDTTGFQQAVNVWIAGQASKTTGVLDLQSGCYLISDTIRFRNPGGFVYGEVRGDGPRLAEIHTTPGVARALEFDDAVYQNVGGFGIVHGGNGTGMGLVLASQHIGLGTCCSTFHDIVVDRYDHCFQLGDFAAPQGSAAEIVFVNISAEYCNVGVEIDNQNTLDFTFLQPHLLFSGAGMLMAGTQQLNVVGGSATGNTLDFDFSGGSGSLSIDGFRSESERLSPAIRFGGNGTRLAVRNSIFSSGDADAPVSILNVSSVPGMLTVEDSKLTGGVKYMSPGSVLARHNAIWSSAGKPFDLPPYSQLTSCANWKPQGSSVEWFQDWWPFSPSCSSDWVLPNASTPTPMATSTPTPTRTPTPTATATPNPAGTISVSPTSISSGQTVTATWTINQTDAGDYIEVSRVGTPDLTFVDWRYVDCTKTLGGTNTHTCQIQVTATAGSYELRYVARVPQPDHMLARSAPFQVT